MSSASLPVKHQHPRSWFLPLQYNVKVILVHPDTVDSFAIAIVPKAETSALVMLSVYQHIFDMQVLDARAWFLYCLLKACPKQARHLQQQP